jgi:hypothetical protein
MTQENLDKYLQWIDQGESFSRIREDLINNEVNPDEIKSILQDIDHIAADRKLKKINTSQGIQWIIAGTILFALSLLLFVIGLFPTIFFASAGMASGMGMMLLGKKKKREGVNEIKLKSSNRKEEFKRRS